MRPDTAGSPLVFVSYADPAFRVGFDITADVMATVANTEPPVRIDNINAVISIANVHGANATGTITETVADLLTKGRFSAEIAARMNNFPDLRLKVAPAVGSALANIFKTAADEQLEEFAS